MSRYKIIIEYDGTPFHGWQRQKTAQSVQEELEKAIFKFSGEKIDTFAAGRTDAGVHATGQVVHFDIEGDFPDVTIRKAINFHINKSISVLHADKVSDEFHARFSAKRRFYVYRIINRQSHLTINKNRAWRVYTPLDVNKMREAAGSLIGENDFTSFRASECQSVNPIKTLDEIRIEQDDSEISFYVSAKSFLHHQVRNIVGTLSLVGLRKIEPSDIQNILDAKDRKAAGPTAPACGLYLTKIEY